jgi:NADH:ubiquinone oxidoreductase subunit 6 (subunit J)
MSVQILLLVGLVLFSVAAVLLKDLIKAAICLAAASLVLGILFFRMGAPYAGAFEISVVAGLITVLFMLTIALTKTGGDVAESKLATVAFPLFFILFLVVDVIVTKNLVQKIVALPAAPEAGAFGEVLWKQRTLDLVGQVCIIFAGVLAVLALFRKRSKDNDD